MAIHLKVAVQFPGKNIWKKNNAPYGCNLLRAKISYNQVHHTFVETSQTSSFSFFSGKSEIPDPQKVEYLTLHWIKNGKREQIQLAINEYSCLPTAKRVKKIRGRSQSASSKVSAKKSSGGNRLSRWWNAEAKTNQDLLLVPQLTFISMPWNHIVDMTLALIFPDIK